MAENLDKLLAQIAEKIEPIVAEVGDDKNYGIFCFAVKLSENPSGEDLQTYTNIFGISGLIAEGLYVELANQIEAGNTSLYSMLKEVLSDLEEDYDIDEEDNEYASLH